MEPEQRRQTSALRPPGTAMRSARRAGGLMWRTSTRLRLEAEGGDEQLVVSVPPPGTDSLSPRPTSRSLSLSLKRAFRLSLSLSLPSQSHIASLFFSLCWISRHPAVTGRARPRGTSVSLVSYKLSAVSTRSVCIGLVTSFRMSFVRVSPAGRKECSGGTCGRWLSGWPQLSQPLMAATEYGACGGCAGSVSVAVPLLGASSIGHGVAATQLLPRVLTATMDDSDEYEYGSSAEDESDGMCLDEDNSNESDDEDFGFDTGAEMKVESRKVRLEVPGAAFGGWDPRGGSRRHGSASWQAACKTPGLGDSHAHPTMEHWASALCATRASRTCSAHHRRLIKFSSALSSCSAGSTLLPR
eukprot:365237-Chlamydomonas_euryale.AAC.4